MRERNRLKGKKGGRYERPQRWKRLILIRMEAFPGRNPLGKKGQTSFQKNVWEEKTRAVRYIRK
jgi:hypothetical protein